MVINMSNQQKAEPSWPYAAALPQRFSVKYDKYRQLGGKADIVADAAAYAGTKALVDVERLVFLTLVFDQICKEGLEGDFAELGVYQGATAALLARFARRLDKEIYLLDTYEGFDQKDFSDIDSGRVHGFGDTSLEAVRSRVGEANAHYIKGYFPETASQLPDDGLYSLVHIDTDLYAPIISGLEYFYPRLVPGGYLIVHDYGSLTWAGAEKAVDKFFADKPESVIPIPDSAGSAVIRRIRSGTPLTWIAKRQVLQPNIWHSAGNGNLTYNLTEGWSAPEPWGVWGVGQFHNLVVRIPATEILEGALVDLDIGAFVWDAHHGRNFEILLNGVRYTSIKFTKDSSTVSLTVGLSDLPPSRCITISFVAESVMIPAEVVKTTTEIRPLGVSLRRIRLRRS